MQKQKSEHELKEDLKKFWDIHRFEIGIPVIDLQHLWLVYLVIQLEDIIESNEANIIDQKIQSVVPELINYVTEHFTLEEDLFKKFEYIEEEAHVNQHEHFIETLEKRVAERKAGDKKAGIQLVHFLQKWLVKHILIEDKKYADFFNQKRKNLEGYFQEAIETSRLLNITDSQADNYNYVTGSKVQSILSDNILLETAKLWKIYKLSVNIPIIDMQHLWLIKSILELDRKSKTGQGIERNVAFKTSIKIAIDYSKFHFFLEEIILKKFRPEIYKGHAKKHKKFLDFIVSRNEQNKSGLYTAISNLVIDFKEWIISHIAIEDDIFRYIGKEQPEELSLFLKKLIKENIIEIPPDQLHFYNKVRKLL